MFMSHALIIRSHANQCHLPYPSAHAANAKTTLTATSTAYVRMESASVIKRMGSCIWEKTAKSSLRMNAAIL